MAGSGGFPLLIAILVVGIDLSGLLQIGIGNAAGKDPGNALTCLVCGYPNAINTTEDPNGTLCRDPGKDKKKAADIYSKACGTIKDFMELLDPGYANVQANATEAGILIQPKWRRDCENSGECTGNVSVTDDKAVKKSKKEYKKYQGVCKKMIVTSSAKTAPGTEGWIDIHKDAKNNKFYRIVRYCGWESTTTLDGHEVEFPTDDKPYGDGSNIKFIQTVTSCVDEMNCNGAEGVTLGKGTLALFLLFISLAIF